MGYWDIIVYSLLGGGLGLAGVRGLLAVDAHAKGSGGSPKL